MTRVAGVFAIFWGIPLTPPGIEVLDGRKLGPGDELGCTHYPLKWAEQLPYQAGMVQL